MCFDILIASTFCSNSFPCWFIASFFVDVRLPALLLPLAFAFLPLFRVADAASTKHQVHARSQSSLPRLLTEPLCETPEINETLPSPPPLSSTCKRAQVVCQKKTHAADDRSQKRKCINLSLQSGKQNTRVRRIQAARSILFNASTRHKLDSGHFEFTQMEHTDFATLSADTSMLCALKDAEGN